jgi:hypothetical protein
MSPRVEPEGMLFRPSFARRSGLREGGKPVPIPDQVEDKLFGIMRYCAGVLILTCLTTAAGSTSR